MSVIAIFPGCTTRRNDSLEAKPTLLAVGKAHEPINVPDPKWDWTLMTTEHYLELAEN